MGWGAAGEALGTGSAAVLMSTSSRGSYEVVESVRTDRAYESAVREEDGEGIVGLNLTRDSRLRTSNHAFYGLSTRPHKRCRRKNPALKEKARCILWLLFKRSEKSNYVANFKSMVQHFCVPTTAKAMIKEMGKGMGLGEGEVEAAMATLHRFGNQSSSSMWYQLEYLEKKGRVKEGDLVWQLSVLITEEAIQN
ncbi:hypothetical protein Sjap_020757 [Stephania japonica]|uniref:Beta-ketoacyl-[acyl-carrier-protein] synthase III C-terminal domain-containing protein n=1 Tax=Stephania japonica TaxID=461633 RepID=A0AAP0F6L7_9MAGN